MPNAPINIEEAVVEEKSAQEKMIRGSAWMTAGSIFSRVLGAIYIIPWMAWMGGGATAKAANGLYALGYTPYALFLTIATAGVPSAIAKQVSYYNALGEYNTGRKLFKKGMGLMIVTGVIFFLIMYLFAPVIGVGEADQIQVIRSLSWALLVIPGMSLIRGFFQGYQEMAPSAISQLIEQIARIIFMLAAVYLIMQVFNGKMVTAVTASTFAAFIGAIFSLLALGYYWLKQKPRLDLLAANSLDQVNVSTNQILIEMIKEAIPFVIIGSGITFFQLIDQYTFEKIVLSTSNSTQIMARELFAVFAFNANKLIMITISIAVSMAVTAIPLITEAFTKNLIKDVRKQVSTNIQLFCFVMFPAAIGMAAVAEPLYTVFYQHSDLGTMILQISCYMSIVLGLFTVLSAILQAMNQNRYAIFALVIGVAVKGIVQYPLVKLFQAQGALYATIFGFCVTSLMLAWTLRRLTRFNVRFVLKRIVLISLMTLIMAVATIIVREACYLVIPPKSRELALVVTVVSAVFGGYTYIYLALKTRLADRLIGARVAGLRRRLRIK
ncbi:putative polysaccharide biosynthesis protein [Carnobacterium gallinarum]|uniref:putative polysaccharide biosynthesis protein n=1 Tax=Carnobacterium gallinarum TaxID=2749 RepID=UPI00054E8BDA|nr:polysaccharide biosynthesis protein [Carnobacterium gallinarum]